jgi:thioredoxin 1
LQNAIQKKSREIAKKFGIQSIHTLVITSDKILLFSQPGAIPESALKNLVCQAKKLDTAEVHTQIPE